MNFNINQNKNFEINLIALVPSKWNIEEIDNNFFKIYYINKGRGSSPKPIILPKKLIVDKECMEAIAMYIGDGKLSNDKRHMDFTSKDHDMIKFMLNFFIQRLKLEINDIRYSLIYNKYDPIIVNKWSAFIGIPKRLINLKQSNRHKEPCFGMQISRVLLREIFGKIVDNILKIDFSKNEELRRAFLRGLFAAEGGIGIEKNENYIAYFSFHLSFDKEESLANFVQQLLKQEGIVSKLILRKKKGERYIQITNWQNYWKLSNIGIFDLNLRKKHRFLDHCKRMNFYCKISEELKELLFYNVNPRKLGIIHPERILHTNTLNVKNLFLLVQLKKLSFDAVRKHIVEFKTKSSMITFDKEFIDFVFEVKNYFI